MVMTTRAEFVGLMRIDSQLKIAIDYVLVSSLTNVVQAEWAYTPNTSDTTDFTFRCENRNTLLDYATALTKALALLGVNVVEPEQK